jgi:hypothetical protein
MIYGSLGFGEPLPTGRTGAGRMPTVSLSYLHVKIDGNSDRPT